MERFGNAKVDDLDDRLPVMQRNEDVAGLDIAVDDAFLVCVVDCIADGNE